MIIKILKLYLTLINFFVFITKNRKLIAYKIFIASILISLLSSCTIFRKKRTSTCYCPSFIVKETPTNINTKMKNANHNNL